MGNLYIYVDESGDLGYSSGGSKYFVAGAVIAEDKKCIEKIPKKVRQRYMKKRKRDVPELKANNSSERIRVKVLENLVKCEDINVVWLWIYKKNTHPRVKKSVQNRVYHYNYLMGKIIELISYNIIRKTHNITLYLDLYFKAKTSRREELEQYLTSKILEKNFKIKVTVKQIDSATNNGLQVVDFVAYALFRCIEREECEYLNLLEHSGITMIKKQIY